MKLLIGLMFIFIFASCSTTKKQDWDSGAQKQEAIDTEMRNEQQDQFRNEFPGQWSY